MIIVFKELFGFWSFLLNTSYHFKNTSCDTSILASLTSQTSLHNNTKKTQRYILGDINKTVTRARRGKMGMRSWVSKSWRCWGNTTELRVFRWPTNLWINWWQMFNPKKLRTFLTKKRDAKRKTCKHCKVSSPPKKNRVNALNIFKNPNDKCQFFQKGFWISGVWRWPCKHFFEPNEKGTIFKRKFHLPTIHVQGIC